MIVRLFLEKYENDRNYFMTLGLAPQVENTCY